MEFGQLFPIEGGWNANATKGAVERDRARKAEMDLMDLIQQMQIKKAEEARAAEKHPLSMEDMRLKNAGAITKNEKDVLELGLERQFGAQKRQADIGKTTADTAKTAIETMNARVEKFFEMAGAAVATQGPMTPQQIQGLARQLELPVEHPVVQAALATDPAKQRQAFGDAMLSDSKTQGQLANTRLQGENQMAVERERTRRAELIASMKEKGKMAAIQATNGSKNVNYPTLISRAMESYNNAKTEEERAFYQGQVEFYLAAQRDAPKNEMGIGAQVGPDGKVSIVNQPQRPAPTVPRARHPIYDQPAPLDVDPAAAYSPQSVPTPPVTQRYNRETGQFETIQTPQR